MAERENAPHLRIVSPDETWLTRAEARANVLDFCAEAYADCKRQLSELDNDFSYGGLECEYWAERERLSRELAEYAAFYIRMSRYDAVETIKHVREGNGHDNAG